MDLHWPLRVVTPTVDGPVLSTLALVDAAFTTGQLRRMLPYSEEGLRRVLKRLTDQGIVLAETVGPAVSYRFNREHLAAPMVQALARLRSALIERLDAELASWSIEPVYAAVFGSVARGDPDSSSDIDLFIVRPDLEDAQEQMWDRQLTQLVLAVRKWTGNQLEIVEFIESELATPSPLLADVRDQGLTVFGKPSWFRRVVREVPRAN